MAQYSCPSFEIYGNIIYPFFAEKWNSIFSIFLRCLGHYIAYKAIKSWHTLNPLNPAQCHELDTKRASPAIVARWSTDRRSGQSERYRYSRFIPHPPQNQSIFYGSQHSLGEVFCYFYKSNDLCFLTGSKRKRPCRGQRESPLFSSSTKKFTPCNQNGRLSAKKRPVVGANRAPIFASNAKKVLPINDQKMQREQPPHFPSFMVYDLHAQIILLDF